MINILTYKLRKCFSKTFPTPNGMKINFNSPFLSKGLILFAATQILGIYFAYKIFLETAPIPVRNISSFSIRDLIYFSIAVFLFLFFTLRFVRFGAFLYRIILTFIIFSVLQLILSLWLAEVLAFVGAVALTAAFWVYPSVIFENLLMIFTMAGLGAIFGLSLTPITVVLILVAFSFYDIIAVYKTGHMVKMAEAMIKSRAIFGLIIPRTYSDFTQSMRAVQPGEHFMILGSGDVILPLVLSASLVRVSLPQTIVVAIFSALGFVLTGLIFANQEVRRPMAALPPIATLSIIGYLLGSLILR